MATDLKSLVTLPPAKPLTPEQTEIAGRAIGTYLQSVWDAGGEGRAVMERILREAEEADLQKAA